MFTSYFSYGAAFEPNIWSAFRQSHRIIKEHEGLNDGLVSVASSKWGGEQGYKGTLMGVSHLDLIGELIYASQLLLILTILSAWYKIRSLLSQFTGQKHK